MPDSDVARIVGRRALVQRREVVVDRDLDLGLVVVGQLDVADRADAAPADLHVVVLDELAGVLEAQAVRGRVAVAQQHDGDDGDHGDEREERDAASRRHRAASELERLVRLG